MGIRDRFSAERGGDTPTSDGTTDGTTDSAVTASPAPVAGKHVEAAEPGTPAAPVGSAKPVTSGKPGKPGKPPKSEKAPRERADLAVWRTRASQLLWTVFVLLALVLAVAALLVAIDANEDNGLVDFVLRAADAVDLGVFSRENGVREFAGDNADTKNALFNWGLGAVAYLLIGRVLERVVRPRS